MVATPQASARWSRFPPDGSVGGPIALNGVTNPTGLAFDPARHLYVLDGIANTITVVPRPSAQPLTCCPSTTVRSPLPAPWPFPQEDRALSSRTSAPAAQRPGVSERQSLPRWPFGSVRVGSQSQTHDGHGVQHWQLTLTLASPYYTTNGPNTAFSVLGSSTCGNGLVWSLADSCSINVQFTPQFIGHTTQQITVDSDAYNGGNRPSPSGSGTVSGGTRRMSATGATSRCRDRRRLLYTGSRNADHRVRRFFF